MVRMWCLTVLENGQPAVKMHCSYASHQVYTKGSMRTPLKILPASQGSATEIRLLLVMHTATNKYCIREMFQKLPCIATSTLKLHLCMCTTCQGL